VKSFRIEPVAECSVMIQLGTKIDPKFSLHIGHIADAIRYELMDVIMNVTPSYTNILVDYLPFLMPEATILQRLESIVKRELAHPPTHPANHIEIPVYYDLSVGPDLARFSEEKGLTIEQVISLHSQHTYHVCAMGFAPGFAFLAEVPDELVMPRHATPRLSVPAGSVAIAANQTAVYPESSPGGWNVIGNCPIPLYNPTGDVISPFSIGDTVSFCPIERDEYEELGGQLWDSLK